MLNDEIETVVNIEDNKTVLETLEESNGENVQRTMKARQYKNFKGKFIGKISEDTFCKNVKKSKHLLRKWNAWGIDKAIVDSLMRDGVQKIRVHEKEENIDYETSVKDFVEKGVEGDFGHGKQIFLQLEYFDTTATKSE
jgi:hypothetical protein